MYGCLNKSFAVKLAITIRESFVKTSLYAVMISLYHLKPENYVASFNDTMTPGRFAVAFIYPGTYGLMHAFPNAYMRRQYVLFLL